MGRTLSLFFVLALASTFLCCSRKTGDSPEEPASSPAEEPDSSSIILGYVPTLDILPVLFAEDKGWIDSAGIDLRLIRFESAMDADTALANKRVHGITSDIIKAIRHNNADSDIKIVTSTDGRWNLVTQRKKRIRKIMDLDERMIATARDEAADFLIEKILEKGGMNVDKTNRPQINSIPLREKMLEKEQMDAAILPEPWVTRAVWRGDRNIASDSITGLHTGCILFQKKVLDSRKAELIRLADVYNMAADYINSHGEETRLFISKAYGIEMEALAEFVLPEFKHTHKPGSKVIEEATVWLLNHYSEQDFLGFRVIKPSYKPDNIIDESMIR